MTTPSSVFALALGLFALLWFMLPEEPGWLAAAIVLGAFFAAEEAAKARGVPGPLDDLRGVIRF